MKKSPDQQLKERIIDAISKEGLLNDKNLRKLEDNYLLRGISIEDWNLLAEKQIHDEEVGDAK